MSTGRPTALLLTTLCVALRTGRLPVRVPAPLAAVPAAQR